MLQGSLENFRLEEVLDLLSNTAKTGRLRISGDRGTGSLWLADGQLADGIVGTLEQGSIEDVVFELMRFKSGNFSFTIDETSDDADASQLVDLVVDAAAERLAEWHGIEAVIPSMDHILTPCPELAVDEITITSDQWRLLVTVGSRSAVREVCAELALGEVDGSRMLKDLVERDLLEINEDARGRADDVEESAMALPVAEPAAAGPAIAEPTMPASAPSTPAAEAPAAASPMTIDELIDQAVMADTTEVPETSNVEEFVPADPFAHEASDSDGSDSHGSDSEASVPDDSSPEDTAFDPFALDSAAALIEPTDVVMPDVPAPSAEDLIEEAPTPFTSFVPEAAEQATEPAAGPDSPSPSELSPFSAELSETADHIGITDDLPAPAPAPRSERPPMPAPPALSDDSIASDEPDLPAPPPSPAEIESFRTSVHDTSALDQIEESAADAYESVAAEAGSFEIDGDDEPSDGEPSSLLMRYLKSER